MNVEFLRFRWAWIAVLASTVLASLSAVATELTATQARALSREAYTYGFPLVEHYRVQYAYFANPQDPEYKAPWNHIASVARVYTPDDTTIQSPNADTPYSFLGADLRAEPLVLSMPAVEPGRYYSAQFIDAYTHVFGYVGSRASGNAAAKFLLAGPGWKGPTPPGIKAVLRSESEFAFVIYRTQLFGPDDLANVKQVQAGFSVQPLSAFLGQAAPPAAADIDFLPPLGREQARTSLAFFQQLNFVLQFSPTHPSEQALMQRFAKLGIGAGKHFDANALAPDIRTAIEQGMADAWADYSKLQQRLIKGELNSGDMVGSREHLRNNYAYRMLVAVTGIYGNAREEAVYPVYFVDAQGQALTGSNRYTLHFAPGQLPPVHAFWSLTPYEVPSRRLVANPLNRYLINSAMLPSLKRDADGGMTLYVQADSPGPDKESNWLPVPRGKFIAAFRLYWPAAPALNGEWQQPALQLVRSENQQ